MNFKVTAQDIEEDDRHISVDLEVSPSDLPYKASLEEEDHKIRIVLGYLNEERKIMTLKESGHCEVELGDNTGRIYSITFDLEHNCHNSCINNKSFRQKIKWPNREERFRKNFLLGDDIIRKALNRFMESKNECTHNGK